VSDLKNAGSAWSETAAIYAATKLAEEGYFVEVYADTTRSRVHGGASLWKRHDAFDPGVERDAVIVSRMPHAFDAPINAPVRALWCHDAVYPHLTEDRAEKMTHIVVLSEWQRDLFAREYPFAADKLTIIRNGIPSRLAGRRAARVRRAVPACRLLVQPRPRPRRALHYWPQIRERVPDAELHAFTGGTCSTRWRCATRTGWRSSCVSSRRSRSSAARRAACSSTDAFRSRTRSQQMRDARVWGYPTYFTGDELHRSDGGARRGPPDRDYRARSVERDGVRADPDPAGRRR
jgi:hypothetical protein